DAVVDTDTWEAPRVFSEIARLGNVRASEMFRVFNMGIGMAVVVSADEVMRSLDVLRTAGHRATQIGTIEPGTGTVRLVGRSMEAPGDDGNDDVVDQASSPSGS